MSMTIRTAAALRASRSIAMCIVFAGCRIGGERGGVVGPAAPQGPFGHKLVLAHVMPNQTLVRGDYAFLANPYHPKALDMPASAGKQSRGGWPQAPLGAACWFRGAAPWATSDDPARDAAAWDIARAIEGGIEGFIFDYGPVLDTKQTQVNLPHISAYFRAAETFFPAFRMTLCLDQALHAMSSERWKNAEESRERRRETIAQFLALHGKSPNLLRTADGRIVFTSYRAINLCRAAEPGNTVEERLAQQAEVIRHWQWVWAQLEQETGESFFFVADLPNAWQFELYDPYIMPTSADIERFAGLWAEAFDGLSAFGAADTPEQARAVYPILARAARERGKTFFCPVWPCFAHSFDGGRILADNFRILRETWALARAVDAEAVQLVTWNDYGEYTAVAPTIHMGFVLGELNRYFGEWYRTGAAPDVLEDALFLIYRRYPGKPEPTDLPGRRAFWMEPPDDFEVLALATEPATIDLPGRGTVAAPRGLSVHAFPLTPGPVRAIMQRGGHTVASVEGMVDILDPGKTPPYRALYEPYAISSRFETLFASAFGLPFDPHADYWTDFNGNGMADWIEALSPAPGDTVSEK
jgi:hypothetical protein